MTGRPLDVLIVHYGAPDDLVRCLRSVRRHLPDEQVRVWDNRSSATPRVRELAEQFPEVDWSFSEEGIGFAAGANRLVARSDQDTLLLNPDAELTGPLRASREALVGNRVAAVSPTVVDPSGREERWDVAHRRQTVARILLNHAGYAKRLRGTPLSDLYSSPPTEVDGYITGCSLLVARAAWEDVGPLDERFFVYGEDPDWQRRARERGWRLLLVDEPEVRHGSEPGRADRAVNRQEDLRAANTAVALGIRAGRGPGNLVLAGDVLLERLQRSKRRGRARERALALGHAGGRHDVVLTTRALEGEETAAVVRLANALAARGHPVTLVCLEGLGSLQRRLDPTVRLVLRPWWLPVVDRVGDDAVLVTGASGSELRFAAGWARAGRGRRRWLLRVTDRVRLASPLARAAHGVLAPDAAVAMPRRGRVHVAPTDDADAHLHAMREVLEV